MTRIAYRPLGENCAVQLRPIAIDETTPRVLPVHRKPAWPHMAIAVDYEVNISVGTLVELDVAFDTSSRRFRGRGVVSWAAEGGSPDKPFRMGVVIYSLHPWRTAAVADEYGFEPPEQAAPRLDSHPPQAMPPTLRQDGPLAEHSAGPRDFALGATAAMLSPLQPLTPSPTIDDIGELLTNLLGEEVTASRSTTALRPQDVCMLGEYVAEDGETTAVALVDLRLAVYLGSALAMIPASAAEADVKARQLTAEVRDNVKEIFNIATSLVMGSGGLHRKLGRVLDLKEEPPSGVLAKLFSAPPFRYDFDVDVPGYGKGRLTYLSPALQITDDDIAASSRAVAAPEPAQAAEPATVEERGDSLGALVVPGEGDLCDLLTGLVGADVATTPASAPMTTKEAYVIADYVEDDGSLTGLCLADVKIANFLGAALAMIPANAAEKDARAKKLSDEVKDNIQEIFNIAASLFNASGGTHHRFRRLYLPHKEDLPPEVEAVLKSPAARGDYALSVPGYGDGKLSVLATRAKAAGAGIAPSDAVSPVPEPEPKSVAPPLPASAQGTVLLPEPEALGDLLTGLVGEEVGVAARSEPVRVQDLVLVGAWRDDAGLDRLLCGFDVKLANFLGAALAMIPSAAALDEIKAKRISDDVFENVREICNIASGAINQEGSVHLKLGELLRGGADLPAELTNAFKSPPSRLDLEVDVPGYGSGKLAIVLKT